ncbi:MAG: hypothetical protein AVDCRST_MAG93-8500, partial [uncultured Chloroflexia bacterium]
WIWKAASWSSRSSWNRCRIPGRSSSFTGPTTSLSRAPP